jgi:hypothetical protein
MLKFIGNRNVYVYHLSLELWRSDTRSHAHQAQGASLDNVWIVKSLSWSQRQEYIIVLKPLVGSSMMCDISANDGEN